MCKYTPQAPPAGSQLLQTLKQTTTTAAKSRDKLVHLYPFRPTARRAIIPLHVSQRGLFGNPFCTAGISLAAVGWQSLPQWTPSFQITPACNLRVHPSRSHKRKALNPGAETRVQRQRRFWFFVGVCFYCEMEEMSLFSKGDYTSCMCESLRLIITVQTVICSLCWYLSPLTAGVFYRVDGH